jgi:hypothetical protein
MFPYIFLGRIRGVDFAPPPGAICPNSPPGKILGQGVGKSGYPEFFAITLTKENQKWL